MLALKAGVRHHPSGMGSGNRTGAVATGTSAGSRREYLDAPCSLLPGSGSGVKVKVERDCTEQTRDQAPPGAAVALPHRPTGIGPNPEDVGCWTFHPLRVMTARSTTSSCRSMGGGVDSTRLVEYLEAPATLAGRQERGWDDKRPTARLASRESVYSPLRPGGRCRSRTSGGRPGPLIAYHSLAGCTVHKCARLLDRVVPFPAFMIRCGRRRSRSCVRAEALPDCWQYVARIASRPGIIPTG